MTKKYHHGCGFPADSITHYRVCVPKRSWPEALRKQPAAHVVCTCGYQAQNHRALEMHRRMSRLHKEPVNA